MFSLLSRNNAHCLHLLTGMWMALRSEVNILGMILGSETLGGAKILAGHIYGFGVHTSEGKIDDYCDLILDLNQPNFGRVITTWMRLNRAEHTPRSSWDRLIPDLI